MLMVFEKTKRLNQINMGLIQPNKNIEIDNLVSQIHIYDQINKVCDKVQMSTYFNTL